MNHHAALKHVVDLVATVATIFAGATTFLQAVTPFFTGLSAIMAFGWWCLRYREYRRTKKTGGA